MKESRQSDREIRVQEDKITDNTSVRSPLTFRNLLYVVAYTQSQKTQRKLEREVLYKSKYSNSLEVLCSFLVHLPNSQVFAVNNMFKIQNSIPF